jgi:hypothetical protein
VPRKQRNKKRAREGRWQNPASKHKKFDKQRIIAACVMTSFHTQEKKKGEEMGGGTQNAKIKRNYKAWKWLRSTKSNSSSSSTPATYIYIYTEQKKAEKKFSFNTALWVPCSFLVGLFFSTTLVGVRAGFLFSLCG